MGHDLHLQWPEVTRWWKRKPPRPAPFRRPGGEAEPVQNHQADWGSLPEATEAQLHERHNAKHWAMMCHNVQICHIPRAMCPTRQ